MSKRIVFALTALSLVLAASAAQADPLALRNVDAGRGVVMALGEPYGSVGGWITPHFGLSLDWRVPSALGLSAGTRYTLLGRPRGAGLELFASAGFEALRYTPGLAANVTMALQVRSRGERHWFSFGIAVPAAIRVTGATEGRLPLMAELALSGRLGPRVWLGIQGGAGLVFESGLSPSLALQVSAVASVPLGS